MKWFGIVALVGLAFYWLFESDAQAGSSGPRTLTASFYGERERGKIMANGEKFNPDRFTCASHFYPLGTLLRLRVANSKTVVVVEVTDRGPNKRLLKTRQIDLSRAAFLALAPLKQGLVRVTVEVL